MRGRERGGGHKRGRGERDEGGCEGGCERGEGQPYRPSLFGEEDYSWPHYHGNFSIEAIA